MNLQNFFRESVDKLKKSSPSAELDCQVLFSFILKKDRGWLFAHPDFEINPENENKINELLNRRLEGEPIAYLTNNKEFYGLDFYVDKRVLIPRPESEWLVERSIKYLESCIKYKKLPKVLDLGTGTGNIIISVAKSPSSIHNPLTTFYASDISKEALDVARKNAKYHSVKINFIESDLFKNIDQDIKFNLIIANLPYVPKKVDSEKLIVDSIKYEPQNAIFANNNGAEIIKRFLIEAKNYLTSNGQILIELDPRNAKIIKICAEDIFSSANLNLTKDLAGFDRYLTVTQSNQA